MTKGEKLIRTEFNAEGNDVVTAIKQAFAGLIDYLDEVEDADPLYKAIATRELESAAMWSVKSVT